LIRYFLILSYKGTNYHGWQRQPNVISVQETIETALERRFGQFIHCMGCGRTDAGVHAKQFFAHVDLPITPDQNTIFQLNKMLPDDIAVHEAKPVTAKAHAQHDAKQRTYEYHLHFQKHPYLEEWSAYCDKTLDLLLMKQAVALLTEYDDYVAFCITPNAYKHTRCQVSSAELTEKTDELGTHWCLRITANRFVRGMIRLLMGRLLEVGRGTIDLKEWTSHLKDGKPLRHRVPAVACGLHLVSVTY